MAERSDFDVVVVGASIAGCTTARLLGLAGARVALVEQRPDPEAHKVVCTHNVLSSANPTIERIGLAGPLAEHGAVRSLPRVWSAASGPVEFPPDTPRGYAVRRSTLDPLLRRLAAETPNVELITGRACVGLITRDDRAAGIEHSGREGGRRSLTARLVVGADGRHSRVARLAALRGRVRHNGRFFYFAYWQGLADQVRDSSLWFLDPDVGAAFPADDGLSVLVAVPRRERLAAFRADLEREYMRHVSTLPGGPDLTGARRTSSLVGAVEVPGVARPAVGPGVALVGDAALASDPVFGTGCGFAFQGGEWLAELASPALAAGSDGDLDRALARYRRRLRTRLLPHHLQTMEFSSRRRLRPDERLAFRAAAADPAVARALDEVTSRRRSLARLLDPLLIARTLRAGTP